MPGSDRNRRTFMRISQIEFRITLKRRQCRLLVYAASILALAGLSNSCAAFRGSDFPRSSGEREISREQIIVRAGSLRTDTGKKYVADFGFLYTRETPGASSSRLIRIPFIRVRSPSGIRREPIFHLTGGPGQSNLTYRPPDYLLKDHDFVLVGYRGVDGSVRMKCPEVRDAVIDTEDLLGDEALDKIRGSFGACATRLQNSGVNINSYTMLQVIDDIEKVRTYLGYGRINLLSQSYGTRLAYIYALRHRAVIFRSVMIGVNPPGRFVWEPANVDRMIDRYSEICRRNKKCSEQTPDLAASMKRVLNQMPRKWLLFSINPGKVKIISFIGLYHRETAAMVFDAYLAAERGDYSGLFFMSELFDRIFPKFYFGDTASKAVSADLDKNRDYRREMNPPDSILGSPFGLLLWASGGRWPIDTIPDEYRTLRKSQTETLLVNGELDFSTPPGNMDDFMAVLERGQAVRLHNYGHCADVWKFQPLALRRLLLRYYDSGVKDTSLYRELPVDFEPPVRTTTVAKGVVGISAGLALLLAVLLL